MPVTLVLVAISAPRRRAPSASANVSWLGSMYPSVGRYAAPSTPSVDIGGNSACASAGEIELERQPERLRPARLPRDLLHPLLRRRETQRPDLAPPRLETDLAAERAGTARRSTSSSSSARASCAAGRRDPPSGRSSRSSGRRARRAGRRPSRVASASTGSSSRRRHPRSPPLGPVVSHASLRSAHTVTGNLN